MAVYLHLGRDISVPVSTILGIFDMDTSTSTAATREYLAAAEKGGRVINVSTELPRSAVVCMEREGRVIYISQLSTRTLIKRAAAGGDGIGEEG